MNQVPGSPLCVALIVLSAGAAPGLVIADTFDYEIGAAYSSASLSTSVELDLGPIVPVDPVTFRTDSDEDDIELFGTWYFSGVESNEGPRSRAGFLSRASSASFRYRRLDGDTSIRTDSNNPSVPSGTERVSTSGDTFSVDARYVWSDSGWYVLGSLGTASIEFKDAMEKTTIDVDAYSAGVGKYLGSTTSIDLKVLHENSERSVLSSGSSSSATAALLTLTRIGQLSGEWQYGTDVSISTDGIGRSNGSFDLRFSLYPTRSLAFGLDFGGQLDDFSDAPKEYRLFLGWFPSESLEISANYGWATVDEPAGVDTDQDGFGIGMRFRF